MKRILYIMPGPNRPPRDPQRNHCSFLSEHFCGDILVPVWKPNDSDSKTFEMGNFTYHFRFVHGYPSKFSNAVDMLFFISQGLKLWFSGKKFDVVLSYGTNRTGLSALVLKWITGAKFIAEIPGNPKAAYLFDIGEPSCTQRLKFRISRAVFRFVTKRSDLLKILYPTQLDGFAHLDKIPRAIFHGFVPINAIAPVESNNNSILFLGFPWYFKGVDLLINAFNNISASFPNHTLKIVGYCPEKSYFEKLVGDNKQIELLNPLGHEEAMKLMSDCCLFVLPSRTEAMGRVLLEAMAAKKPIVASNVDGIPYYITNEENGLLFESENTASLENALRRVLSDKALAAKLAENGWRYVHEFHSEKVFTARFREMVSRCLEDA